MKKREMVDLPLLQKRAKLLQHLLAELAEKESLADACLTELQPMLSEILAGRRMIPYKEIPCGHYFHFDELRKYRELESAYSKFAVTARGIDDEDVQKLMASINTKP